MVSICSVALGLLVIVWTLIEVFSDLFQPSAVGSLSSFISKRLFAALKRWPSKRGSAGPLTIVIVISCWAVLVSLGFALLYWSAYPTGFNGATRQGQSIAERFATVLYCSLGALTTLGSGQIQPNYPVLRLVVSGESRIGISLITASITWIVLIYPALARVRVLTRKASVLVAAQNKTGVSAIESGNESVLAGFAEHVIRTHSDFVHFPLIYYFEANDDCLSLSKSLQLLLSVTEVASQPHQPDGVRLQAEMLRAALDQMARMLARRFLKVPEKTPTGELFKAVAEDHLRK